MIDQAEKLRLMMQSKKPSHSPTKSNEAINIYTIASGKGGVGKTNVVVNLAIALQKRGKKVLIIDADLGLANVDVILGVYPKYTLYDVLFHGKPLKEAIMSGPMGIKFLPGGSGILEMAQLSVEQQEEVAKEFFTLEGIDTILIDTGAGLSKNLLSFIAFSQELVLVTTPEPTALTDAYGVIKVLAQYHFNKSIKIIINRALDKSSAENTFEKLQKTAQKFLNISLGNMGYVLDDSRVVRAIMNQTPFVVEYPQCLASKCIYTIADEMIGQKVEKNRIKSIQQVYNRLIKVFG